MERAAVALGIVFFGLGCMMTGLSLALGLLWEALGAGTCAMVVLWVLLKGTEGKG